MESIDRSNLNAHLIDIATEAIEDFRQSFPEEISRPIFFFGSNFSGNAKYLFLEWAASRKLTPPIAMTESELLAETLRTFGFESIIWKGEETQIDAVKKIVLSSALIVDQSIVTVSPNRILLAKLFQGKPLIQLWHGVGTKKVEASRLFEQSRTFESVLVDLANLSMTTMLIVPTKKSSLARDFLSPRIILSGYPRIDVLHRIPSELDLIGVDLSAWEQFRKPQGSQFSRLLYAPTWNSQGETRHVVMALDTLRNYQLTTNSVIGVKLHAFSPNFELASRYPEFVWIDNQTDIQPFLTCTDVLLSDYSSIVMDFLWTNRPIHLFIPDFLLSSSSEATNGSHFVGQISRTKDQLLANLIDNEDKYKQLRKRARIRIWGRQKSNNNSISLAKKLNRAIRH